MATSLSTFPYNKCIFALLARSKRIERKEAQSTESHSLSIFIFSLCTYLYTPTNTEVGKGGLNHAARFSTFDKGQRVNPFFHKLAFLARATCCACSFLVRTSRLWRWVQYSLL